jgi:hypothetical protein
MTDTGLWDDPAINAAYASIMIPPNPPWATDSEPDYPSVEHDGETFVRHHRMHVGPHVSIWQCEHNRANVVTFSRPVIDVASTTSGFDERVDELDSATARRIASELIEAAAKLDEIQAAQR